MALTFESIMAGVMNNPDVALIGVAVGYILAKGMAMRKRNRGFGGGGMI